MTPYEIAWTYIGTVETPGPANNPVIIEMYASVGHDWVEHDSVAWCAAVVGHCIEKAGLRSTRRLNARSYLDWGVPVDPADAQEGDVVVFSRGDPSGWKGHVGFFVRATASSLEVLGGNQSDAVNIRRYSKARLLGVRRAGNVAPAATLTVREVQARLRALGYHEVGTADGIMGPRTRGSILAFRDDTSLPLVPIIDTALAEALEAASPRQEAPERAEGVPADSRIVTAANAQIGLGRRAALYAAIAATSATAGWMLIRRGRVEAEADYAIRSAEARIRSMQTARETRHEVRTTDRADLDARVWPGKRTRDQMLEPLGDTFLRMIKPA